MKKALLVCYGGGHANLMAPVHRQLLDDGRMGSTVLALSVAKSVFADWQLPFRTPVDYAESIMDVRAERYGLELASRWHVPSTGLDYRDSVVYLGASMRDLVDEVGEDEARRRLDDCGRRAFVPLRTLETIVEAERPDVIVATNSPRMERAATLVGNRLGIPTLNVHDDLGFFGREYLLTADRIAVMSDITKENLVTQGHDRERIVVTGHPAFDAVPRELQTFRRDDLVRKFGLPPGPCVLLGTSRAGQLGQMVDMCPTVCDVVAALGDVHLIVKPHPAEDADAYRAFAAGRPERVTVVDRVNIRELLFVSELLITFASTTMIESILMGKPVVSFNETGAPDPLPFVRWNLGVEATTPAELARGIRTVLHDRGFHERFQAARAARFGDSVDGGATQRVVGLIHRLAGVGGRDN